MYLNPPPSMQAPYGLPSSRLQVASASLGKRIPVNMLQLFASHAEYAKVRGLLISPARVGCWL